MNCKKRLLFISFICLYLASNLIAQPTFGIQAGGNIAALGGYKDYDESTPRFGLSAYVYTDIPLGRHSSISIETGLGVSQQGMNLTKITEDIAIKHTTRLQHKLDYAFVPIYLKENMTNFYTKIGPYGAYLISAKSTFNNLEERNGLAYEVTEGVNKDFQENANLYDFGISFGFGYIHVLESARRRFRRRHGRRMIPVMQVDLRFNLGFSEIGTTGDVPGMDLKNRTFTLGVTFSSVYNK